jgi:hypothetical protein
MTQVRSEIYTTHLKIHLFEDLRIARMIILKWILEKMGVMMWTRFMRLRIQTVVGMLL